MRQRLSVVLTVVAFVTSACSLGPRGTWADELRNAYSAARSAGGSHVHVDVSIRVIQTTIRVVPSPLFVRLDGDVNYRARQTMVRASGGLGAAPKRDVYFDDLVTYLPRSPGAIADHNGKLDIVRYDFRHKPTPDTIDATDRYAALGFAIPPALAVELLKGVLAGSLKREGTSTIDGQAVTQYSGKIAPDALTRDLRNQGRVDGITRLFKILGVSADLFPFHAWMDSAGRARKIEFSLKQQEDPVDQFRTTLVYTFSDFAAVRSGSATPPCTDCLVRKRFVDFVAEYTRAAV